MTEALKCPSCSAPLQAPPGNATSMRCPYCNTTVMLTSTAAPGSSQAADGIAATFAPLISDSLEKAKLAGLLRQGSKIEAIKYYRQITGTDLHTAKTAIDQFGSPNFRSDPITQATRAAATGVKLGIGLTIAILLFVAFIMTMVFHSVHTAIVHSQPAITVPTIVAPSLPQLPAILSTPAQPAFADMKLEFGAEGMGAGQFQDPRSIAIDNSGNIYVGEYSDGRVQIFDPTGKFLSEFTLGKGDSLQNIAADHQGNLYLTTSDKITRYDAKTHTLQNQFETATDPDSYDRETFSDCYPTLDGKVYAVGGSHIIILTPDGKITKVYKEADAIGQDVELDRIAVSGEGAIYVLDRTMGVVFKFGPDGRYINRFGGKTEGAGRPGYLNAAQNIAVDGQGRVYVSGVNPAIQVFDPDGRFIDSIGGSFGVAFGITLSDQNEIYAVFRNDHKVRKYVINKKPSETP